MTDINWAEYTNEEVVRACLNAPRIFGPWEEWDPIFGGKNYAWSRGEVFPGPRWKSGGSISVQRNTGCEGYTLSWWGDGTKSEQSQQFATAEEAMVAGDIWLSNAGIRIQK